MLLGVMTALLLVVIIPLCLLIMQEYDMCTRTTIFCATLYTQDHVRICIFLIDNRSVVQHTLLLYGTVHIEFCILSLKIHLSTMTT
jgi:hypothetical protein